MIEPLTPKSALRRDGFTFKQFFIAHDRCAMKVGTDGVLLGAWAPLIEPGRILDIGTGSGLIALMLAQRTAGSVAVEAIEIDSAAADQAAANFAASPWASRLRVVEDDILHYAAVADARYGLIVSNPPYFPVGPACRTRERQQARYTATLTHERLLEAAARLLSPGGLLCLVLPQIAGAEVIALAQRQGWQLRLRTDVADGPNSAPHRVLLGWWPPGTPAAASPAQSTRLTLRDDMRHYSAHYRALTQDFYLSL